MSMTQDQLTILQQLSTNTRNRLIKIARRIAEGYEGEIALFVKRGAKSGPSGIASVRWTQTETGDVTD